MSEQRKIEKALGLKKTHPLHGKEFGNYVDAHIALHRAGAKKLDGDTYAHPKHGKFTISPTGPRSGEGFSKFVISHEN